MESKGGRTGGWRLTAIWWKVGRRREKDGKQKEVKRGGLVLNGGLSYSTPLSTAS